MRPSLPGDEFDEGAEVHDPGDAAGVGLADLDLFGEATVNGPPFPPFWK